MYEVSGEYMYPVLSIPMTYLVYAEEMPPLDCNTVLKDHRYQDTGTFQWVAMYQEGTTVRSRTMVDIKKNTVLTFC